MQIVIKLDVLELMRNTRQGAGSSELRGGEKGIIRCFMGCACKRVELQPAPGVVFNGVANA